LEKCGISKIPESFNSYIKKNSGKLNNSYKTPAFSKLIDDTKDSVFFVSSNTHSSNQQSL